MKECAGKEVVVSTDPAQEETPEPAKNEQSSAIWLVLLLAAVAGLGAAWYIKVYKPKQKKSNAPDPDDYDFGGDEDEEEMEFDESEDN